MTAFKSNVDLLDGLLEAFKKLSAEWGLEFERNEAGDHPLKVLTFFVRTQDATACANVRVVLMFEDQVVVYAKLGGVCRTVNFNVNDHTEFPPDFNAATGRLISKLIATIFAPLFRPNKEYQNLSQMSAVTTAIICSYLSATELCQLAQTNRSINRTASTDSVWNNLIATDFPKAVELHVGSATDSTHYNANHEGDGAAKARYRELYLQQVIANRNIRVAERRYLEALEQERQYLHQMRADNYPSFAPDLVLPPLRLGLPNTDISPPFRLPPYRNTYDTWF